MAQAQGAVHQVRDLGPRHGRTGDRRPEDRRMEGFCRQLQHQQRGKDRPGAGKARELASAQRLGEDVARRLAQRRGENIQCLEGGGHLGNLGNGVGGPRRRNRRHLGFLLSGGGGRPCAGTLLLVPHPAQVRLRDWRVITATVAAMMARKAAEVVSVPSPRPPNSAGCETKSPTEAPSGRVKI